MNHWNRWIALQVIWSRLRGIIISIGLPAFTVLNYYKNNLLYIVRKDGRECWVTAPREGGDVTGLEV